MKVQSRCISGKKWKQKGGNNMNVYYAKTVLYAYPNIGAVIEQIDELVERKALCSINDYSPCIEIAEKILDFTSQKVTLMELNELTKRGLKKFTEEELDHLDYKYFKQKPKEYYIGFDFTSRNYFRRQQRLIRKFSESMEKIGATDEWFEKTCLKMDFFKEMLKRVYEHEKNSMKNKPKSKTDKKAQGQSLKDKKEKGVKLSA